MAKKQKSEKHSGDAAEKHGKRRAETDLFIWPFVGLALIKEQQPSKKTVRQLLLLAKAGIDFLLLKVGVGEAKPTEVKKIKIQ